MPTNKAEPVKLNGCGAIAANDEAENIFYIFFFKYILYTFQDDLE